MNSVEIVKLTVNEVTGLWGFSALIAEYAAECATEGMPPASAKFATYHQLEAAGLLHVIAAVAGKELLGFLTLLVPELPHYGVGVAVSESFFVGKAHRHTLAGLRLLARAEALAAELGSPGFLVSAPFEGDLHKLLPKCGYRETNRIFFKQVSHG